MMKTNFRNMSKKNNISQAQDAQFKGNHCLYRKTKKVSRLSLVKINIPANFTLL